MAIATLMSHVYMAKQFESNTNFKNLWLGISQGPLGGWKDEVEPPDPTIIPSGHDITTLDVNNEPAKGGLTNLLGVKHVSHISLVVPIINNDTDNGGLTPPVADTQAIVYKSQQWEPVKDEDAYKYGARWVYLETHISPEDLPYGVFRQTGVYYGLQPKPEFINSNAQSQIDASYSPSQLEAGKGFLLAYDNQRLQGYYSNVALDLKIVMEF